MIKHDITAAKSANGPVLAESIQSAQDGGENVRSIKYTCYDCDAELIFRKFHHRTRNGVAFPVRPHFAHASNSSCPGTGESALHKAGKHAAVITAATMQYFFVCGACAREVPITVWEDGMHATEEVVWRRSDLSDERVWRLDVAMTRDDAVVVGVVEVKNTHACTEDKLIALTEGGLAWVEVDAHALITAAHGGCRVQVLKCAFSECHQCIDKKAETRQTALQEERARLQAVIQEQRQKMEQELVDKALLANVVELRRAVAAAEHSAAYPADWAMQKFERHRELAAEQKRLHLELAMLQNAKTRENLEQEIQRLSASNDATRLRLAAARAAHQQLQSLEQRVKELKHERCRLQRELSDAMYRQTEETFAHKKVTQLLEKELAGLREQQKAVFAAEVKRPRIDSEESRPAHE